MLLFWRLTTASFYLRSSAASTLMSFFSDFLALLVVRFLFCCGSQLAVDQPADNVAVAVNATVPQERPVAPDALQMGEIALDDQDLLPVLRSLAEDDTERIRHERTAPELKSSVRWAFVSHAVYSSHIDSVGDGVSPLNCPPSVTLGDAVLSLSEGCQPIAVG